MFGGGVPHLMVTDPPYGVEYDADWRRRQGLTGKGAARGKVHNDDRADWGLAWVLFPGQVAYVWHSGLHALTVENSLTAAGFEIRTQIIWNKRRHVIGRGDYHWKHEPCWYAVRKGAKSRFNRKATNGRKQNTVWDIGSLLGKDADKVRVADGDAEDARLSTVWEIEHQKSETGHSTQKPVECMRRPILNNSAPGDRVYDPFLGSGTTLIAAEMEGRICHAMEISPAYVNLAIERWENYAGAVAVRSDGVTLAQLRAALAAA